LVVLSYFEITICGNGSTKTKIWNDFLLNCGILCTTLFNNYGIFLKFKIVFILTLNILILIKDIRSKKSRQTDDASSKECYVEVRQQTFLLNRTHYIITLTKYIGTDTRTQLIMTIINYGAVVPKVRFIIQALFI
jgi:hypothetical protein